MSNEENTESTEDAVGYKNPPKQHRWQKGETGNKRGSSKKVRARGVNHLHDALGELVSVQEGKKTVYRTMKHIAVRRRVDGAATGDMAALRELLKLRDAPDGAQPAERPIVFSLEEIQAAIPFEGLFNAPNIVFIRAPDPAKAQSDPAKAATAPKRRRRRPPSEPRSQTFQALIDFEMVRRISITNRATGKVENVTMREAIVLQLVHALAKGKKGAMPLFLRLNRPTPATRDKRTYVEIPHDYVLPADCAGTVWRPEQDRMN